MSLKTQRRKSARAEVETLESRRLLAAFGTPWPNARDLTVSFPSDGAQIGQAANEINSTLDLVASREDWHELALRAYQTWAVHTDINVGLQVDHNHAFGAPGMLVNDPRFGEFRIGAFPQEGLLASSLPFQLVAGTYSGDILLNTNEQFKFHDWADDQAPDPTTYGENDRDLFSLLLHETGNTLGVEDTDHEWSVMFRQYTVPKGMLSQEDIDAVVELYGARTDPYEVSDNNSLANASPISSPALFDAAAAVIRTRGSLQSGADVDVYELHLEPGQDSATIRVDVQGISLLMSHVEVLDESGQVLASDSAESIFANDNSIAVSGLQDHDSIFIRVSATDASDIYSAGDYEIVIDYRDASLQALAPVPAAYDAGQASLFTNFDLNDLEVGENNTPADAIVLNSSIGDNYFDVESSVVSGDDVDLFKIASPIDNSTRLLVSVSGVGVDQPDLRVHILDSSGNGVGAKGYMRNDGTWTLQVAQPVAGAEYFVRVSVDANSDVGVGNYIATALFEQPSAQMNQLIDGDVSADVDDFIQWTAEKSKLFRFDLSVVSDSPEVGVKLTIYDAHTRIAKMSVVVRDGSSRSALAWLQQGDYILRFTAITPENAINTQVHYTLLADGISDDQDEDDEDPDVDDDDAYTYEYVDQSGEDYDSSEYEYDSDIWVDDSENGYSADYEYDYGS